MDLKLIDKINRLKKEKNAVILVHNYQRPEIYRVADFIGDSLELSREAAKIDADIIVFCGVDFMAESAKILNPEKKVLIPVKGAECPMAGMVTRQELLNLKRQHPRAAVVSYVNTSAETKAESDICCTSSNCIEVVNSVPEKEVIFVPDENLAKYVQTKTDKRIIPWKGFCYVHAKITAEQVREAKGLHPEAKVLVHPECPLDVIALADKVCSTSQMLYYAKEDEARKFIIITEHGMVERLKLEMPEKKFYSIVATCIQQKKNTLPAVLRSIQEEVYPVEIDDEIIKRARKALDRMLEVSRKSD
ncbi:MAG: Quinolinate synthetase [Candidatus Fermentimicrarchaeum limneticum]|uniref:Quinolinate synthase n=1 Tax=Fermentimicrarchaeum limneticum TaxID=2795018 RepID=A0A7D6BA54_FERL1|nr:MAG: Quinolinate synthetase [Candidatus Fermentimicrarchaeum limneticum]